MNGNNIIVCKKVGTAYVAIAATKSNEIQSEAETIEISSPTQGQWRSYISGLKGWSLSLNKLLDGGNLSDLLKAGDTYKLFITTRDDISHVSGDAILKVCKQSFTRGNVSYGTYQFIGISPLQ